MNGAQNFIHLTDAPFVFQIDARIKVGHLFGQRPTTHELVLTLVRHLDRFCQKETKT